MPRDCDLIVVGGGIVGLAHAAAAVRKGMQVALFERDPTAIGASIRNFGMIWIVGQPQDERRELALRSRTIWSELSREAGFWCEARGSVHVAYADDEYTVLDEFVAGESAGLDCAMLTLEEAMARIPSLNPDGLRGAMWSPLELAVNPREAIPAITQWLARQPTVTLHLGEAIMAVGPNTATTAYGDTHHAERIFICSGSDVEHLYPEAHRALPITRCKLQMMATNPQPDGWRLPHHLAGGLSLRHYESFANCPSIGALRARVAKELPEYDRYGIHVLVAQLPTGELILGDSHEYGNPPEPFNANAIDRLILDRVHTMLHAPDLTPARRWSGTYLKRTDGGWSINTEPEPGVRIVNALGGSGMTLSFALADKNLSETT